MRRLLSTPKSVMPIFAAFLAGILGSIVLFAMPQAPSYAGIQPSPFKGGLPAIRAELDSLKRTIADIESDLDVLIVGHELLAEDVDLIIAQISDLHPPRPVGD